MGPLDLTNPQTLDRLVAQIPDGKHHAIVTSYDGKALQASYVQRINDHWAVAGDVEWHGGEPQVGVQLHGSW